MREIGFFRELDHGNPDGPSLRDSVEKLKADASIISGYLAAGTTLAVSGQVVRDALAGGAAIEGSSLRTQTDGEWVWPSDLAHYVTHYRIGLPDEFIRKVNDSGGVPPQLTHEELVAIEEEIFKE